MAGEDVDPSTSKLPGLPGFHPYNIQPWTLGTLISVTLLAFLSVALRLAARRLTKQILWWDDWMIIFSMAWYMVCIGCAFTMNAQGMGIHADLVNSSKIILLAKWLVAAEVFYAWNLGWTKLAVLLMYYRVFRIPFFKRMTWIIGSFVIAWVICVTFLFIFICVPVEKLWYPDLPGRCIDQVGTWIANAASTILTDLLILLLPIRQIWVLQLRNTAKIGLTLAFGLGFFVIFASAYRTSVLFTYSNLDPTYTLAPTVGWTAIEMSAGIVSANLPTLLPVIVYFGGLIGIHTARFNKSGTGSRSHELSSYKTGRIDDRNRGTVNTGAPNSRNTFDRLSDEAVSLSEDSVAGPASGVPPRDVSDAEYLESIQGHQNKTISYAGKGTVMDEHADDFPLNGIRVKKEFSCDSKY
uniref:Rhodopsin domain-containing protein n=1 Tax=Bionectria ochroleuca TaxID=29856 RepID=A0A8H7N7B1_BIOOC